MVKKIPLIISIAFIVLALVLFIEGTNQATGFWIISTTNCVHPDSDWYTQRTNRDCLFRS